MIKLVYDMIMEISSHKQAVVGGRVGRFIVIICVILPKGFYNNANA